MTDIVEDLARDLRHGWYHVEWEDLQEHERENMREQARKYLARAAAPLVLTAEDRVLLQRCKRRLVPFHGTADNRANQLLNRLLAASPSQPVAPATPPPFCPSTTAEDVDELVRIFESAEPAATPPAGEPMTSALAFVVRQHEHPVLHHYTGEMRVTGINVESDVDMRRLASIDLAVLKLVGGMWTSGIEDSERQFLFNGKHVGAVRELLRREFGIVPAKEGA